jgi:hypothetical protein
MKRALPLLSIAGAVIVTFAATNAFAADEPTPNERPLPSAATANPRNAVSLGLVSLANSGVTLEYERFCARPWLSVATAIGVRASGGGTDYDVLSTEFGGEARFWMFGKEAFSKFAGRAMVGPYLGARLDYGITRESSNGHAIGTSMSVGESLALGVRVAFLERIALTPSIGAGLRTDFDPHGKLAPWTRGEILRLGLNAGVMF